jgi:hypothetical protein
MRFRGCHAPVESGIKPERPRKTSSIYGVRGDAVVLVFGGTNRAGTLSGPVETMLPVRPPMTSP